MSFSFTSMIRLIVALAMGSTMLAVGLSRLSPPRPASRASRPASFAAVNDFLLGVADRTPRWIDVDEGRVRALPLEDDDVLEAASCSPWVDEKGTRQVIGRWSSRTQDGPMSMIRDFGLARYTFPGGRMLDQVSTGKVPAGPPSWFPGTRARVLFAAGDGELYHYAFEPEAWQEEADPTDGRDPEPGRLAWRCPRPGLGGVFLGDLSWPDDPRMGGRVVVSLREQTPASLGARAFTRTGLWWLRLNGAGTEIVEAGRLLRPDVPGSLDSRFDERFPTVSTLPDGRPILAYLVQRDRGKGWQLRTAPIDFEGDRRAPVALESRGLVVATHCQPSPPAFSTDGRWLNAMTDRDAPAGRVVRFPTEAR